MSVRGRLLIGSYPLLCLCGHSFACGNSLQLCLLEKVILSLSDRILYSLHLYLKWRIESALNFKLQMLEFPGRECVVHTRGQLIHRLCDSMCHLCSRASMVGVFLSSLFENSRKECVGDKGWAKKISNI